METKRGNDELLVFFPEVSGHITKPFTAMYSDRYPIEDKPLEAEDKKRYEISCRLYELFEFV